MAENTSDNIITTETFSYQGHVYKISLMGDVEGRNGTRYTFGILLEVDGKWISGEGLPGGMSQFKSKRKQYRKDAKTIIQAKRREFSTS